MRVPHTLRYTLDIKFWNP